MTETLGMVLEELRQTKQELKLIIEAAEVRLTLKVEEINNRLNKLERENYRLKEELEVLERKSKEKNIVIFGLKHPSHISFDFISQELKRLVGVEVLSSDLSNFYPLGKNESCPIKVEFVSYLKKASLLENAKQLKGTNVSIANDLTIKQRQDYKILRNHLYLAKQDKNTNCFIKNNKLHVNNKIYSVEDLEQSEVCLEADEKSISAPGTPSSQSHHAKEILKPIEKQVPFDSRNQRSTAGTSPVPTGTVKKLQPRKDQEEKNKVETRSKVSRNILKNS